MLIGLSILIGLIVFYLVIEYFSFTRSLYSCKNFIEEISIHFIHGSYPKKNCFDQRKTVGGLLGGHIEIEIDGLVYGFEFGDRQNIHIFPRNAPNSFNGRFTLKKKADWILETKYDKITTIRVPIDALKKTQLIEKLQSYKTSPPYDYAFFGMRCASSTYEDIATAGVLPKKARFQYVVNAFYPRQLRKKMVRWARTNMIMVEFKKGVDCRVWE